VALFGLGKFYFDSGHFSEALIHLEKLVHLKPDFSMAFYLLGKSLVSLKRNDEAKVILSTGIARAKEQGEMMPQKGMEETLARINQPN
jgi:tetratricopeptide (TPR) repeat protein